MDLFLFLSLILISTPLLIFLIFYKHTNNNNHQNFPPGKTGWPIIGETHEFVSTGLSGHPERFFKERMNKYSSEIFKTAVAGETLAVFCGPSGNKFLFSNENKLVGHWSPSILEKIFGDATIPLSVMAKKFHEILPEFIKPEALKKYVAIMDCTTRNQLERDWSSREVQVFPLSRNLTFSLSCKLFMSIEDPLLITKFGEDFKKIVAGLFSVPVNLPGTTFNHAIKAANLMREELFVIIKQRRKELEEKRYDEEGSSSSFDLLSKILVWIDKEGKFLNEMEIANMILGVLMASHESTSMVITFVVYYLADHPDVYAKVLEEQVEILKSKGQDELLNWDDIQRMKYSRNVINEVLRLQSTVPGFFRQAITDFTYGNFFIPKGWKIFWSVHTTHKDPKYFPNPEKFDPSRFEGKGPIPFTFVPFGGGPSMCPGKEYARIEVLVFVHRLVTKFKWEKLIPNEKIVYEPSPVLVNGLPVRLSPH